MSIDRSSLSGPGLAGLACGLLFGVGLALSGMTDPRVVTGFLDVAGAWNPALLLVMGGAVPVTMIGYRLAFRRRRPLLAEAFTLPTARSVDGPLLLGAALFGIGWGLAGYCPGPALASLTSALPGVLAFVAAMGLGLGLVKAWRAHAGRAAISRDKSAGV